MVEYEYTDTVDVFGAEKQVKDHLVLWTPLTDNERTELSKVHQLILMNNGELLTLIPKTSKRIQTFHSIFLDYYKSQSQDNDKLPLYTLRVPGLDRRENLVLHLFNCFYWLFF